MGLSFTVHAGPRQWSHSRIPVSRDWWPYFTVSYSRLPQRGGSGHRIYIPQQQGGPVIPPRHWVPFSLPRYSNPPPHGIVTTPIPCWKHRTTLSLELVSYITTDGQSASLSWCQSASPLRVKHPSGAYHQIFKTVRQLRACWCGALSDERTGLSFTIYISLSLSISVGARYIPLHGPHRKQFPTILLLLANLLPRYLSL
jgi:hypothetical protein